MGLKKFIESEVLGRCQGVKHGFSTRFGGPDLITFPFLKLPVLGTNQVHGVSVLTIDDDFCNNNTRLMESKAPFILHGEYDAIITDQKQVPAAVKTADCIPVIFSEKNGRAAGSVHCGWRSTAGGILKNSVDEFQNRFSIEPPELRAAIGPGICQECFEVGDEVIESFKKVFGSRTISDFYFKNGDKFHFNLKQAVFSMILDLGIQRDNVDLLQHCTMCSSELFHSYRRSGEDAGRQWSVVMIEG